MELRLRAGSGLHPGIQIRAGSFSGERPPCPRGCARRLHRHGAYYRYAQPSGGERLAVSRYCCPDCGLTVSVLPAERLPYRSLEGRRLEAFLDAQARIRSGPDPPPGLLGTPPVYHAFLANQASALPMRFPHFLRGQTFVSGGL